MSVPAQQRGRRLRRVFVLLAPLAAVLGTFLAYRYSTAASLGLAISKNDVVRIATAHAAAKGVNAAGWRELVDLKPDNDLRHYLAVSALPAERAALGRVLSPVPYRCVLENAANAADSVRVTVSPAGRLISYRVPPTADARGVRVGEAQARQAAEEELQLRLGADRAGFALTGSGVQRHEATSSEVRQFTFRRSYGKELALEASVETSGTKVIGFTLAPRISPERTKRFPELGKTIKTVRGVSIFLLVLGGLVYVIFRFVRRLREQEIPLKRTAIVAAFVFVAFASSTFLTGQSQRIDALERGAATGPGIDFVLLLIVASLMSALLGITWGACEADLREAYPEKLTSTDALLGGMVSSRAVRSSLAVGLTFAGWAILLSGLESLLRALTGGWAVIAEEELIAFRSAFPGLVVILLAFASLPVLMGMLMAAVSVTHRKGRTRNTQIALALLVLFFYLLGTFGNHTPMAWGVVQATIAAAVLLVPFLAGDVLAVIVATAVLTWAVLSAPLIAQPAATFRSAGWTMIAVLVVIVGGGAIAAFRKRETPAETEVEAERPVYARNIAERLMLKTEMDAARTAQLRVMPRVVPAVDGARLAARHSASGEIGSDYYEFFPSPGHVSVAVADARLPGLSSALCVSMLKGLLLNYAARLTDPRDVADRVYRQLAAIFGHDLPLSFFFGRLDRATGAFAFSTFGVAPHAAFVRAERNKATSSQPMDLRTGATSSQPVGGSVVSGDVHESVTSLEGEEYAELQNPGSDAIVIYTAGLAEMQDRDGAALGDEALRAELAGANSGDPQRLVDALFELAARRSRGVDTPQSWTAVAIALAPLGGPQ